MFNILMNNNIRYLAQVMVTNGYEGRIEDINAQTILSNLRYLAKTGDDGNMWIPLPIKRILEKVICGYTNTTFEFQDKEDVYFESFGEDTVCVANVYWVQYDENGNRKVLGHGFHSLPLSSVLPGEVMSTAKRVSLWKALTIGGAKSRALYEGGIGMEFYGEMIPEILQEELENEEDSTPVKKEVKEKPVETEEKPKRGRPRKEVPVAEIPELPITEERLESRLESPEKIPEETSEGISVFSAKQVIADCSDLKGKTLEVVMNTNPKRLVYIAKNSESPMVREAARKLVELFPELKSYL